MNWIKWLRRPQPKKPDPILPDWLRKRFPLEKYPWQGFVDESFDRDLDLLQRLAAEAKR